MFSSEAWAWALRDAEFGVPAAFLSSSMHHASAVYALASDPGCVLHMDVAAAGLACAVAEFPEPTDCDGRLAHYDGCLHYVTNSSGPLLKV